MRTAALPHEIVADFTEVRNERRADRRASDRRAARAGFHPLFAATLVNHVAKPEATAPRSYAASPRLRAGIAFDLRV